MNFSSYLDEFQPTEFRRSSKESLETLLPPPPPPPPPPPRALLLSHVFFKKRKMGSFVPNFLLSGSRRTTCLGSFLPRNNLFHPVLSLNLFFMNFIQFNSQFSRFSQKSLLFFCLLDVRCPEKRENSNCLEIRRNSYG